MNPGEPAPADLAAVNSFLGGQPQQPAPQPAPQSQPTEQPQPQSQPSADPFASFGQPQPTPQAQLQAPAPQVGDAPLEPTAPQPQLQPQQPQPQPQEQPQQPQPQQQPQQQPQPQAPTTQSFDDYIASLTAGIEQPPEAPKLEDVNQEDPAAVKQYFDDLMRSARDQAVAQIRQEQAVVDAERRGWDEAFGKYESLRANKNVRDTIQAIRMQSFRSGIAMTPLQAAEQLLELTNARYRQGAADTQVVTTIQDAQPTGGGNVQVIPDSQQQDNFYQALGGSDGEALLTQYLDKQIKNGQR